MFRPTNNIQNEKLFKSTDNIENRLMNNEIPVLQINIGNLSIENLTDFVTFMIPCIQCYNLSYYKCVFWDEYNQKWKSNGILTEFNSEINSVICHSSHLTSFSILYDFVPSEYETNFQLSLVTYIGCYLSIVGLMLTIFTYCLFR